eukprot:4272746-Pyramimonas_sp.AAC.1
MGNRIMWWGNQKIHQKYTGSTRILLLLVAAGWRPTGCRAGPRASPRRRLAGGIAATRRVADNEGGGRKTVFERGEGWGGRGEGRAQ